MVEEVDLGIQDPNLREQERQRRRLQQRREERRQRIQRLRRQQKRERRQAVISSLGDQGFAGEIAENIRQGQDFEIVDGQVRGEAVESARRDFAEAGVTPGGVEIDEATAKRVEQGEISAESVFEAERKEGIQKAEELERKVEVARENKDITLSPSGELIKQAEPGVRPEEGFPSDKSGVQGLEGRDVSGVPGVPDRFERRFTEQFAPDLSEQQIEAAERAGLNRREAQAAVVEAEEEGVSSPRTAGEFGTLGALTDLDRRKRGGLTQEERQAQIQSTRQAREAEQVEAGARTLGNIEEQQSELQKIESRVREGDVVLTGEEGQRLSQEESLQRIEEAQNRLSEREAETEDFIGERKENIRIAEQLQNRLTERDRLSGVTSETRFERLSPLQKASVGFVSGFRSGGAETLARFGLEGEEAVVESSFETFQDIRRGGTGEEVVQTAFESPGGQLAATAALGAGAGQALRGLTFLGATGSAAATRTALTTGGALLTAKGVADVGRAETVPEAVGIAEDLLAQGAGFGIGFGTAFPRTVEASSDVARQVGRRGVPRTRNRLVETPERSLPGLEETGFRPAFRESLPARTITRAGIEPVSRVVETSGIRAIRNLGIKGTRPRARSEFLSPEQAARTTGGRVRGQGLEGGFTETELKVLQQRGRTPVSDIQQAGEPLMNVETGTVSQGAGVTQRFGRQFSFRFTEAGELRISGKTTGTEDVFGVREILDFGSRKGAVPLTRQRPSADTDIVEPNFRLFERPTGQAKLPRIGGRPRAVQAAPQVSPSIVDTGVPSFVPAVLPDTIQGERPVEGVREESILSERPVLEEVEDFDTFPVERTRSDVDTGFRNINRLRSRTSLDVNLRQRNQLDFGLSFGTPASAEPAQSTNGFDRGPRPPRNRTDTPSSTRLGGGVVPPIGFGGDLEGRPGVIREDRGVDGPERGVVPRADLISASVSELTVGQATTPVRREARREFGQPQGLVAGFETVEEREGLETGGEALVDLPKVGGNNGGRENTLDVGVNLDLSV